MTNVNQDILEKIKGPRNAKPVPERHEKPSPQPNAKLKPQTTAMFALGLVDVLLISLVPRTSIPSFVIIMAVGVLTFFGWLAISVQFSNSMKLDKGEIRKGIAGSFLMVYFAVLALVVFGDQIERSGEAPKIMDGLTQIIEVIIVFYFSSRTAVELTKAMRGQNPDENGSPDEAQPAQNAGDEEGQSKADNKKSE